jgi:hypothetical protein
MYTINRCPYFFALLFYCLFLFIPYWKLEHSFTKPRYCSRKVCQKDLVVQTLPAVMHAVGCSIPQHPNAILRDAFRLTTYPVWRLVNPRHEPGIYPYMEQRIYVRDTMLLNRRQSVHSLIKVFGKHGYGTPKGNTILKRGVGSDHVGTEVLAHKHPWLRGEEITSSLNLIITTWRIFR